MDSVASDVKDAGDKVKQGGHDHSLESDICSIFACLAVSRDHDLDDEEKLKSCPCEMVKLRSEDARKMIQRLVMHEDHLDDVEAVILNMLTLDRTSMSASDTTIPSALAALTMLVRKNCVLRERFFKSGDTTNTLLEILECKNANVARITSACILSFEEHHRLVTSLYKPNVITDKKGEQVTEISGWDVDTIRQSLRAISALVKDSTVSSIGFDSAILEVICTDRRMLVLTSKIKATIEKKINKSMDYPSSRALLPRSSA